MCLQLSVNWQGLFADKKRKGKCFGAFYFGNACTKRVCERLDRNVADKMLYEYLYRVRPVGRGGAMGAPAPPPPQTAEVHFFVKKINSKKK